MRNFKFEDAVSAIVETDQTYQKDAYFFLRDSLDYTVKYQRNGELEEHSHVSGLELLDGMREYALKEFGPMSLAILESWGIKSSRDVGALVYNLIEAEAFGRSDDDDQSDFDRWFSFEEAFQQPFRPKRPVLAGQQQHEDSDDAEAPGRGNKPMINREA